MEKQRTTKWLQIKVLIGLGSLVLGAAAIITYINILTHENHANHRLLSYVKQLDVQGQAIKRRGETYAQQPPRDYAPYFRDVIIFYPDFMKDLDAFENQIAMISQVANDLPESKFRTHDTTAKDSITHLQAQWKSYKTGLLEKLGNDLKEPRLEWGAEYVKDNQALITSITGELIQTVETAINNQLEANNKLTNTAITSAGVLLLLGIIWFYFNVIRRVAMTIDGCQRVATGDFGFQLETSGNDELSTLAKAFNTLSSRTRFVVNMLSKMHSPDTINHKVEALIKESLGYLPIQWLGLWEYDSNNQSLTMTSMFSERTMSPSLKQTLIKDTVNDPHLLQVIELNEPTKFDTLPEDITNIPESKLMKEFVKFGFLNSAMLVPLKANKSWQGLFVFVAEEEHSYSDEQLALMKNLAPFIADGLSQSIPADIAKAS